MRLTTRQMTMIAVFPALMAATASINIPMVSEFPAITLQTLFVFIAALLMDYKGAGISMFVYVLLGAIWIPVFAGNTGGMGILLSKSGGFLIGFIIAAIFISYFKNIKFINNDFIRYFIVLVLGNLIIYMCGSAYIAYLINGDAWLVFKGMSIFYPGDIIKIIAAIYVYVRIRQHITYERA